MRKQFGTTPSKADLARYSKSSQWNGKIFINAEPTANNITFWDMPKLLYKAFCKEPGREPAQRLPVRDFNRNEFEQPHQGMKAIWYGHSAVLLRINNLNIFVDPMLGPNAAPISPFAVKRYSDNTLNIIDQLPELDLLLMSHDHYDHLDFDSISKLKTKVKQFYVALGVARHLNGWGVEENKITEFDWWDEKTFGDITITFTPTRHFSGRGLTDSAKSLWGGWAFKTKEENIWFSGDGGYGKHFLEIGQRLGPFDFGFMESGQYNELWHLIHMYPEESVQAAIDARVKSIMPVHWAAFSLAQHSWIEPAERFVAEAERMQVKYCLPTLGEMFDVGCGLNEKWWSEK